MYYSLYSLPLATATNKMAAEIRKNSLIASSLQLFLLKMIRSHNICNSHNFGKPSIMQLQRYT